MATENIGPIYYNEHAYNKKKQCTCVPVLVCLCGACLRSPFQLRKIEVLLNLNDLCFKDFPFLLQQPHHK